METAMKQANFQIPEDLLNELRTICGFIIVLLLCCSAFSLLPLRLN